MSSHWARHFFVTYSIIQRGIPIEIVQQTVGHSNKSVTAGYVSKHLDKQKDASWGWDEKEFSKI
ncbi:site-specific integrase [Halalkalibacterium ligniniphilum]|uniref:site-specific integrase n=1 Tax=Halalkalibacterium ligniniphilum TaxID=1134413 RepID=UPI0009DA9422|nr:site-specific integrase [Halalkalibacterium ligniniphilum]